MKTLIVTLAAYRDLFGKHSWQGGSRKGKGGKGWVPIFFKEGSKVGVRKNDCNIEGLSVSVPLAPPPASCPRQRPCDMQNLSRFIGVHLPPSVPPST